jgi:Arc/MetJ family transcription regulator
MCIEMAVSFHGAVNVKRTNVVLDEKVVGRAKKLTGIKVTRQLVDYALRELLRHRKQRDILKLRGKIEWEGNLAEMRRGRSFE